MEMLNNYLVPVIVALCLIVGYVIKHWIKDADNKMRHNRHRCGVCVDTALCFGLGHSLYPVDTAFELDPAVTSTAV